MTQVARRRTVHADIDRIWTVLADFGSISTWAPNVEHSSLTTRAGQGVGATRRVQVGRNALLERVTVWEPGRTLAYEITGLPKAVRSVENRWTLARYDDATEVTLTSTVVVGSRPPQRIVERIVARVLAKAADQLVAGLATHVEGKPHV